MKKMEDNSKQVLNLYEIHEVEQEEKNRKNRILPIILIIFGIISIISGVYYKNIIKFITDDNKNNKPTKVEVSDDKNLRCNYKKDDIALGITYIYSNSYKFENRLLKSSSKTIVISPITNSDIGPDNIKIINGKYTNIIKIINTIDGITATSSLINNKITIKYNVNYRVADLTKIPPNDKIIIDDKLDDNYVSIKKKNQLSNYLC